MKYKELIRIERRVRTLEKGIVKASQIIVELDVLEEVVLLAREYVKFFCVCGHSALLHDVCFDCYHEKCPCTKFTPVNSKELEMEDERGLPIREAEIHAQIARLFCNETCGQIDDRNTRLVCQLKPKDIVDRNETFCVHGCADTDSTSFENEDFSADDDDGKLAGP